jgi:EpsI family protein
VASNLRFAVAAVLLTAVALFLHAQHGGGVIASHPQFSSFPQTVGEWVGRDERIAPDVLVTLGAGDFLARTYQTQYTALPPVSLFVAYFPSQGFGNTLHSPKNCLPGAGWFPLESSTITISVPGREPFPANRYLIAKGAERGLVIYWYWTHDRSSASEYWAKLYLIEESIRFHRSDGALVRFTTEVAPNETEETAERRLNDLLKNIVPSLRQYLYG